MVLQLHVCLCVHNHVTILVEIFLTCNIGSVTETNHSLDFLHISIFCAQTSENMKKKKVLKTV